MRRLIPLLIPILCALPAMGAEMIAPAFDKPPHDYWSRPLKDPFTKLKTEMEAGRLQLDASRGEKAYLLQLLQALGVPASSQMLIFSTTSLQLRFITPANPRALYFNENVYVGYIPGARIEVVSVDPDLGGIYYIFDIPRGTEPPHIERSNRCMNCHAAEDTDGVPGLVIKSVLPGIRGGSLDSYRHTPAGHNVPFAERFGGWYVTGAEKFPSFLGNAIGQFVDQDIRRIPLTPGERFDYARYPVATSDVLPQLVHEHQIGFVNRAASATYRTRALLDQGQGRLDAAASQTLDAAARAFTRYLFFADEVPLPNGGVVGDNAFKSDFLKTRRVVQGGSLKDFDLQTHLFRYRCSYMIESAAFGGLPPEFKQRVYRRMWQALDVTRPDPEYTYLPPAEKQAIHTLVRASLTDLPAGW